MGQSLRISDRHGSQNELSQALWAIAWGLWHPAWEDWELSTVRKTN
ncbi:hypothetical protein [Limnothrix sp. PR1529]|nr:hypothetical protein [Limnothrix sp. PR1529]